MAVKNAMFIFEVVVENIKSMVENRGLVIKSDFANIFSLELKDPKQMHITMPEPLPLPPEPVKKGKKKKKAKPKKPKKGKKGKKKGVIELPPPEPAIQVGQSVLFSSTAELLIQNMKKSPLAISLWSKEENLTFIGNTEIHWDPIFIKFLEQIMNCQDPPSVTLKEEYNIFEEGKAKLMAKITLQVKLSHLNEKVTTAFRSLSEDPNVRKCLYTGINSKTTSFMCTLKTSEDLYIENSSKVESQYVVDKPKPTQITFADYKNAPGANLTFFDEKDFCCLGHADKPPESKYKAPETCPDIDFIIDYVRKIIVSCNDNMRMLTPRPTISPRVKATDIDRLCYCRETTWPTGALAERFKHEAQIAPCPICIDAGKKPKEARGATFDIANIRGPCGKPECKIAREIRAYIENLVDEDNVEFNLEELIGPCGSKDCTLVSKIQDFLRHEGDFTHGATLEGTSTQCACVEKMKQSLSKRSSCESVCSKDCDIASTDESKCGGEGCPFKKPDKKVYDVYYFTVEYDFKHKPDKSPETKSTDGNESDGKSSTSKYKFCGSECPSRKESLSKVSCSKTVCSTDNDKTNEQKPSHCSSPLCPQEYEFPPSPADSNIEMQFDEIHNPCCVKSCNVVDKIKEFIADAATKKGTSEPCGVGDLEAKEPDPCYCDCVCTFKFSSKTTYCPVCGGYECLGDDMQDQPDYIKPHPCPVYHKLYDKTSIKVPNPWPEDDKKETQSSKSSKGGSKSAAAKTAKGVNDKKPAPLKKENSDEKIKKTARDSEEDMITKKVDNKRKKTPKDKFRKKKSSKGDNGTPAQTVVKKEEKVRRVHHYPPVPRHMGWNWEAEDVPGMKYRPNWKPGAANAILVRRYRAQREGQDSINKKKRALMQRKKKIEMKPTLVVTKHDGEYTVQMEVFKKFSKERLLFQYPYDEKPPIIYTIGKTEEEKRNIQKQRDKRERRETRRKSRMLQSTFRDRCQEICLKAYNQAIGLLPLPNPNAPDCPCNEKPEVTTSTPIIDSCSCSDVETISSSDTDNDEWVIEFTPPMARWDAKAKHPPTFVDGESQYNYLDYKVKVLDKSGNAVPRYFKGPDGKQECSDLGGFWSPNHVWLEINKDGYIGLDNRWVPMSFTGPDGLFYSAEEGSFTDNVGQTWKIGVDGYIDKDGNWQFYPKKKPPKSSKSKSSNSNSSGEPKNQHLAIVKSPEIVNKAKTGETKVKKEEIPIQTIPGATAVSPVPATKSKMVVEKKKVLNQQPPVSTSPQSFRSAKEAPKEPPKEPPKELPKEPPKELPKEPPKELTKEPHKESPKDKKAAHHAEKVKVMSASIDFKTNKFPRFTSVNQKALLDYKKIKKYREIIEELRAYNDIGDVEPPVRANRASNTLRKKTPSLQQGYMSFERKSLCADRSVGFRTSTTSSPFYHSTMTKSFDESIRI